MSRNLLQICSVTGLSATLFVSLWNLFFFSFSLKTRHSVCRYSFTHTNIRKVPHFFSRSVITCTLRERLIEIKIFQQNCFSNRVRIKLRMTEMGKRSATAANNECIRVSSPNTSKCPYLLSRFESKPIVNIMQ